MSRRAGWLRTLGGVAVAALLACAVVPRFGAVYVGGRSMEPALRPGDLVIYRRTLGAIAPGDVLVVRRAEWRRSVVHRVVDIAADGRFVTRGDANEHPDLDPVAPSDTLGEVIGVLPLGRGVAAVVWGAMWCYNRLPIANTRL